MANVWPKLRKEQKKNKFKKRATKMENNLMFWVPTKS